MGLLIKGGEVVTALDRYVADVLVENGVVARIGRDLEPGGHEVVNATGRHVMPGGIDVHTHLDMPFMGTNTCDDFETGHIAAAAGGTTTHIDFVIPGRGQSLLEALRVWRDKAARACIDYTFHMAIVGWSDDVHREMAEVVASGVTSFKCFLAYKGALDVNDGELLAVFERARQLGALVTLHCENAEIVARSQGRLVAAGKTAPRYHYDSRPPEVEGEGTSRAIAIAGMAGAPMYVVHLTCTDALEPVRRARASGRPVWAETCIQYFLLTRALYEREGFEGAKWVLSPPLRDEKDQEALWGAIADGSLQVVSTDHAPFTLKQKEMGKGNFCMIPNGIPAIEERQKLLYTYGVGEGRISLERFVEVTSTNPAKIFGMFPKKGTVAVGSDADLVVWDPRREGTISAATHVQKSDYSAFEGFRYRGAPQHVFLRGRRLVTEGKYTGEKGQGRFVPRKPFDPAVYGERANR